MSAPGQPLGRSALQRIVSTDVPAVGRNQSWSEPPETDAQPTRLWEFVWRNRLLILACSLVTAAAGAIMTRLVPPSYVSTTSIRIDQRSAAPSALEALGLAWDNAVATELEMLRSRVLAEEVVDSLGLQLVIQGRARRSDLFARITVDRAAGAAQYRLTPERNGQVTIVDRSTGARLRTLGVGGVFAGNGLRFTIAQAASRPTDFEILPFQKTVDLLQADLHITRRNRDADIIDVGYRGSDPVLASEIVDVLARRFLAGRDDVHQEEARSTVRFLSQQIGRVAEQLRDEELALQSFRRRERVVSLQDEASTGVSRVAELQAQRNAIEVERSALAALLRSARMGRGSASDSSYHDLLAFPTLLHSATAATLLTSLTTAEERRSALLERRTRMDPELRPLDNRIAQVHAEIESMVGTYLQGLGGQEAALDQVLAQSNAKLQTIPSKEMQLADLERSAKSSDATYAMLQSRLQDAEIAAAARDFSVRLVDPAIVPRKPVAPKPLLNIGLALLAGVVIGVGGAYARESADRSLHTRRELLSTAGVPVIGMIPHTLTRARNRQLGWWRSKAENAVTKRPILPETDSMLSQAFSWLATNLSFLPTMPAARALVITSAQPGDGKTTVAIHLASTLARAGRRVLLVDGDLHSGRVAAAFGVPNAPGLAELLTGELDREQAVRRVEIGGTAELHFIVSGKLADASAHALASREVQELVAWAKGRYELTIIDTAPVNVAADAALVALWSDGVLMVARAGATARDAVQFAMEQLAMAHAPIAGAVLNDVDPARDRAYGRYHGDYHPYRGHAPTRADLDADFHDGLDGHVKLTTRA